MAGLHAGGFPPLKLELGTDRRLRPASLAFLFRTTKASFPPIVLLETRVTHQYLGSGVELHAS